MLGNEILHTFFVFEPGGLNLHCQLHFLCKIEVFQTKGHPAAQSDLLFILKTM